MGNDQTLNSGPDLSHPIVARRDPPRALGRRSRKPWTFPAQDARLPGVAQAAAAPPRFGRIVQVSGSLCVVSDARCARLISKATLRDGGRSQVAGELRERYWAWVGQVAAAARRVCPQRMVGMVVFGSVGRDRPHDGSDIDALLVMHALPVGRSARAALAGRIEDQALRAAPDLPELSLVLRTVEEVRAGFPLLLDMIEDGRVVDDAHGALQVLLAGWKARLALHGARRVFTGESWHWDLAGSAYPGRWSL